MSPSIGLIISSIRQPRINPQVADFVLQTIKISQQTANGNDGPVIKRIDLAEWDLPFTGEPGIPARIKSASEYRLEKTQAWSWEISSHDAIIFVTPQYNWGYPPSLKNAIDLLFNEWVGKPAMLVTYGGHGGGKCADALLEVLRGIKMKPIANRVELTYPDMNWAASNAFVGADLKLDASSDQSIWAEERPKIVAGYEELAKALQEKQSAAANAS